MLYPKSILELVAADRELWRRFPEVAAGGDPHVKTGSTPTLEFERWLVSEGAERSIEVRRFVAWMEFMLGVFSGIERRFPRVNRDSKDEKDAAAQQTSVDEMLVIARLLYCLDSYGVAGDLLECGCFKGFSSCCLSWACASLGRRLIIADSFEGLPVQSENPYYKPGEFKGGLEEVQANLRSLGRLEAVDFIRGFYSKSLPGFSRPLAMIWMDVDLFDSARDVLVNTFDSLADTGVIVSNELIPEYFEANRLKPVHGPAKAIAEFLQERGVEQSGFFATGVTGVVFPRRSGPPRFSMPNHEALIDALRGEIRDTTLAWRRQKRLRGMRSVANRLQPVPVVGGLVTFARNQARRILLRSS